MKQMIKTALCILLSALTLMTPGCKKEQEAVVFIKDGRTDAQPGRTAEPDGDRLAPPPDEEKPEITQAPQPSDGYLIIEEGKLQKAVARNDYSGEEQRIMVEAALSLIGRVSYFWGGKSYLIGEDPEWGKPRKVTSKGDSTTGMTLPYGLDCSGFVFWCAVQLGKGYSWTNKNVGEGTWKQWECSVSVERQNLRPGDIAFINEYPGAKSNHVGIVVGFLENGEPLIAHCTSIQDSVIVSTAGESFKYFRRFRFLSGADV